MDPCQSSEQLVRVLDQVISVVLLASCSTMGGVRPSSELSPVWQIGLLCSQLDSGFPCPLSSPLLGGSGLFSAQRVGLWDNPGRAVLSWVAFWLKARLTL